KDGLSLAIKIYGIIPDEVKDYVKGLIRLPEFDFSNISLPEYKLDVDSKFLAVTIYELKPTGTKSLKAKIDGTVSIQLLAFVGDKTYDDQKDEDGEPLVKSGLYILPYIKGSLQSEFNIGESHKLSLNASASLNDGYEKPAKKDAKEEKAAKEAEEAIQKGKIGFFITTKDGWAFDAEPLADTSAIKAYLELLFSRGQIGKKLEHLVIYSFDVLSITAEDYPQKGWVGYSDGFDAGYKGEIQNLDFTLSLKKVNSFFDTILSDDIKFKLDKLSLGYSYKKGFEIEGEASVRIPINTKIDLKAARLSNLAIELAFPDFRGVEFGISTNLSADLNCVKFTLGDVGFGLKTEIFDENYKLKGFNLSPSFLLPDGIGISVDIEKTIKGTGALKWNKDTGEIVGAAELIILEMCGASAMFILNTKPVDGAKFSFMGALCVYFTPSSQIGMGFSIAAIGGSLGLNRRIDTDKMIEAVRNGSLSTILFVKDLDKNLDTVLGNMSSYYPVAKNTFFFGALAQISWAEKFKIEFGLFIQAPDPVLIIIAGGLHFSVAEQADKLLSINANFLGIIDFSKGISFDADLVDSHIVGIELHGSLALRIYWAGDTKGFILSAGGFHPQYTPEAGFNVGGMKRLGMKLDYSILKISMDSYFAVTSNTVQFGSDSRLQVGWDKFGLLGYMYYNALFQFKPFAFMFDAGIGVSVKCGSWTLMSLSLDLDVSGPAPWRVKGNASFWFILVKIKVSFDKSWGKKQKIGEKGTTGVFALYSNNFEDSRNWTVISTDMSEGLVVLAEYTGTELMMSPSDTLMFNQTEVPLDQKMEKFGETVPDCQSINLKSIEVAMGQTTTEIKNVQTIKDSFAPSVFKNMKEDEKLSSPSYVKMNSGFKLKEGGESRTGNFKKVDSPADKTIESLDIATWREAIAYASKTSVGTDKKSEPVLPKELALSHYSSFKSKPGKVAKEVQSVKGRTFKASSRRTNDGFRRYIAAMDGSICQDMSELKAKLNETSEA
ncbi:MAG: hypothetical protein MJZ16_11755, partial [Bacteroidales bacterium]|nr:hypothetical protein [Bacteroidales bacterium]